MTIEHVEVFIVIDIIVLLPHGVGTIIMVLTVLDVPPQYRVDVK